MLIDSTSHTKLCIIRFHFCARQMFYSLRNIVGYCIVAVIDDHAATEEATLGCRHVCPALFPMSTALILGVVAIDRAQKLAWGGIGTPKGARTHAQLWWTCGCSCCSAPCTSLRSCPVAQLPPSLDRAAPVIALDLPWTSEHKWAL